MSTSSSHGARHPLRRGGLPRAEREPFRGRAEDEREGADSRAARLGFGASAREWSAVPLGETGETIQLAPRQRGIDERDERDEAPAECLRLVRHGDESCHMTTVVVNAFRAGVTDSGESPVVPAKNAPTVADRIRAYVAEQKLADPAYSLRRLSTAAGLAPTYLSVTLRRLDAGGDLTSDSAQALALAMGRSVVWLLDGTDEAPPASGPPQSIPCFGELRGWSEAVAEAAARYSMRPEAIRAVAKWRPDAVPTRMDAMFVASLVRAWEDLQGR